MALPHGKERKESETSKGEKRPTCSRGKIKNLNKTYTTNTSFPFPSSFLQLVFFLHLTLISNSFKHPELFHKEMNWLFRCLFVRQDLTPQLVKHEWSSSSTVHPFLHPGSPLSAWPQGHWWTTESATISPVIVSLNLAITIGLKLECIQRGIRRITKEVGAITYNERIKKLHLFHL